MKWSRAIAALACLAVWAVPAGASAATHNALPAGAPISTGNPDLGPNVIIFNPRMSTSAIQATVDAISAQQLSNQFGTQRYALLFEPGTYGTATDPLNFQVGYYTSVAGLGASPRDVIINGSINAYNQCDSGGCVALNNFWRSLSNLTINVANSSLGCHAGEFWAVSQASPMRRVQVNGNTTLMDYCTGPSFASGGFIADSAFTGGVVINGSQQQWFVRNSALDLWTNSVWNQVFLGASGAPATSFGGGTQYTNAGATPISREAPFLYEDANGAYRVLVPATQTDSVGTSWSGGATAGTSIPIDRFFVANPGDDAQTINSALARGENLIFTPGVYRLDRTLEVKRADTVVLGLGFPTLVPTHGQATMTVANVSGVKLSGLLFDAGPMRSPVLLQVGPRNAYKSSAADPTTLSDVFFRIGGATAGSATDALVVNSDNVVLDDIWAWRADHGNGVGWTQNTADTGLVVNGDNVHAYGLAVEHFQKSEVIWNGQNGEVVFFQNEMPYDPPSQAAWMASPTQDGYPAFLVGDGVTSFQGYGMGSYSFFNQHVPIYASNAFQAPDTPGVQFHDLLTIFLDATNGSGGILNVINGVGGSSTIANPDTPVDVTTYP